MKPDTLKSYLEIRGHLYCKDTRIMTCIGKDLVKPRCPIYIPEIEPYYREFCTKTCGYCDSKLTLSVQYP